MIALERTRKIIRSCLQLGRDEPLSRDTVLIGGFSDFDSLAIVSLITEIEDSLGCKIEDEELNSELFETVGSVADFIESKMASL